MADASSVSPATTRLKQQIPDLPLVIWMVLLTLALGLIDGMDAEDLVRNFNIGFGRALGEFALILLPSFTIAAALSARNVASEAVGRTAALASPIAGAGMICPDTAYAALSPAAGRYRLEIAFGSYAGFKLLYPAGPLIVAAGLGVTGAAGVAPLAFLACGVALTLPVWAAGVLWGRMFFTAPGAEGDQPAVGGDAGLMLTFAPFALMAGLLMLGGLLGSTGWAALDLVLTPKGALAFAAALALLQTQPSKRRDCLDSAVRRTGSLLLVIGAASAFGAILTGMFPLDSLMTPDGGAYVLIGLFALSAFFKLVQGSSMATFAAIAPVAAPIVLTSDVNTLAAVFAICLGSFVSILPNDSYYWLVRRDMLKEDASERRALRILSAGSFVQALVGLAILLVAVTVW
ncbi:MAG: permease [Pseudomonadota bacterium]